MKDIAYNLGGFLHLFTWKDYLILLLVFLILVLLLIIYYLVKIKDLKEENFLSKDLDLKEITKKIEQEEPKSVTLTDYEEEQEDKAIISYQELLEKSKRVSFENFDDEYQNFEVKIKKVNLDENSKPKVDSKNNKGSSKIPMISDEKETDFLDALKKLQTKLIK